MTFSRSYPSYHPKAGQPTHFVKAIMNSLYPAMPAPKSAVMLYDEPRFLQVGAKHHTIRAGHRWKAGDWFSPRVWSGKPYASKQITFAPDIQVKKTWDIEIIQDEETGSNFFLNGEYCPADTVGIIAHHDGLSFVDMMNWFKYPKPSGPMQIICWDDSIEY
jgi:hypothetical protein